MDKWMLAGFLTLAACASGEQRCLSESAGETTACIDIYDVDANPIVAAGLQASLAILCGTLTATPEAGTCPDAGKLAGCDGDEQETYRYTEWTYAASGKTAEEVTCGSDEVKVGPDGAPYQTPEADTDASGT